MTEASQPSPTRASNLESLILRKIAGVKSSTVATALGHEPGHISRILSNERGLRMNELEAFFKVIGLAVIECNGQIVQMTAAKAEALRTLALESLSREHEE